MKKLALALFATLLTSAAHSAEYKIGELTIDHPLARATPVNAPVSGGYMTITNNGEETDYLIKVVVDFAGKTEIHEMRMDGDVMKMREVEGGIEIPAGETVKLMPGGYHIMFMKLENQLKDGEEHQATLSFKNAGDIDVTLNVESLGAIKEAFGEDNMKMDH